MNNQFVALTNGFRIDTMGSSEGALYFETRYYGLAVGQAEATLVTPVNTEGTPSYFHKIISSSCEAFSDLRQECFQLIPILQHLLKKELESLFLPRKLVE